MNLKLEVIIKNKEMYFQSSTKLLDKVFGGGKIGHYHKFGDFQ